MSARDGSVPLQLEDRVHGHFAELNRRLQRWLNGTCERDPEVFDEMTSLAHPELSYVFPGGSRVEGGVFWEEMRAAWGANQELRMSTPRSTTRLLFVEGSVVVAEAVELQDGARAVERPRHARRSTLVFQVDDSAPWGLLLRRLHESLLPPEEEESLDWSGVGDKPMT